MSTDHPSPERVLTIGAHPDDAEFGAGGTLAKWARAGAHITILVMTDGSKGTWDPVMSPEALVTRRIGEQRAAADLLGVADVVNLGHSDGELEYSMDLREETCFHIRRIMPNVVLSHDPWRQYMLHPDHRATGWAAIDGVVAARDHLFFPDQLGELTHHRPDALLLWAAQQPDHWEDVNGYLDQKISALLAHSTQTTTTMEGAGDSPSTETSFAAEIHQRARAAADPTDLELAEAFQTDCSVNENS